MLPLDVLIKLKRWNTPSVYNGWEHITKRSRLNGFNMEETATGFMDNNECETVIGAALAYNHTEEQINAADEMNEAAKRFSIPARAESGKEGEWK